MANEIKKNKTYKFKDKAYARPLILSHKDYYEMFKFEFERLNPNIDYDDFWEDL